MARRFPYTGSQVEVEHSEINHVVEELGAGMRAAFKEMVLGDDSCIIPTVVPVPILVSPATSAETTTALLVMSAGKASATTVHAIRGATGGKSEPLKDTLILAVHDPITRYVPKGRLTVAGPLKVT